MSLRLRLTLLCVGLVALVLGAFAVSTFLIARARIYSSFDDSLQTQASAIMAIIPSRPGTELSATTRSELETQAAAGALFEVRGSDGNVLFSSLPEGPNLLPKKNPESKSYFDRKVTDQDLRLLYVPLSSLGPAGPSIEVAKPTEPTDEALTLIGGTLASGSVLALLLTVFPAYFIAGRALAPIREVSGLARRIEQTSDFSQRLRRERSTEEIAELIVTFNDLIARIEHTLRSHNEFLADSSHELRRPLTTLRTNLDILREPGLSAADRTACIDRISHEALAMSALVGDLLLLTRDRSQAFNRSQVDLSALSADAVSRAGRAFPAAPISPDIEPGIVVLGDRERLGQMLRNLLENAVNYSPAGSPVALALRSAWNKATLTVEDAGYGIPDNDLPRVFDRFYRGEQARAVHKEGVGLGLAIVKHVVDVHGGTVSVENRPNGGSLFTVALPLSPMTPEFLPDVFRAS